MSMRDHGNPSVYSRILSKAAELVGGERALARYLKVPQAEIYAWLRPGASPPPAALFLNAIDLVLNDLDIPDEQRAQSVRVAVIHEDQRRAAVMRRLDELLPEETPSRHGDDSARAKARGR
jgi:hypothetical protein